MARSGWVAVLITALLVAGLGSPPAFDRATEVDGQVQPLLAALTSFPAWSTDQLGGGSDMLGPIATKVVLLLVVVFIGAGITGRVGSATASFLATWCSVMVGAALAGGVFLAAADAFVHKGVLADEAGGAGPLVLGGVDAGVQFGLYTGWLVGLATALMARRADDDENEDPPQLMAGSAPGYPTVYPPLPSNSQWTGPLTQPVPAAPARPAGRAAAPATQPQAQAPASASAQKPLDMWPQWPDTPADTRGGGGGGARRGAREGTGATPAAGPRGAYRQGRDSERPNWTRWSDKE